MRLNLVTYHYVCASETQILRFARIRRYRCLRRHPVPVATSTGAAAIPRCADGAAPCTAVLLERLFELARLVRRFTFPGVGQDEITAGPQEALQQNGAVLVAMPLEALGDR